MKIKSYLFAVLLLSSTSSYSQAPAWAWVNTANGSGYESATALATDAASNVYICGQYTGGLYSDSLIFGNDTLFPPASVAGPVFLAKYDPSGNLVSTMNIAYCTGTVGGSNIIDMKVDALGNIYICGMFGDSTITLGGTTTFTNAAPGTDDFFLAKYNAAGTLIWAKYTGGDDYDEMNAICLDQTQENIYCTGGFISPSIVLGSITLTNSNTGNQEVFVAKYDSAGNVLWAKKAPNTGNAYYDAGNAITTDLNGDLYAVGDFYGSTITFGSFTLNNAGTLDDIFIAKYDALGNVIWAKRAGGTSFDRAYACAITSDNKLIVSGQFYSSSISFGTFTLTNAGATDIFLAKYDSSGNVIWAKGAGGSDFEYNHGCAVNSADDIFIGGGFSSGSISFGSTTLTNVSAATEDIYLAKYDSAGNALWAKSAGGSYVDECFHITTDVNDNVFIAGDFWSSSIMFDSLSFHNNGPQFSTDAFVAKVSEVPSGIAILTDNNSIDVFPNPSEGNFIVSFPFLFKKGTLEIFNECGAKVFSERIASNSKKEIHLQNFSPGTYFAKMFDGEKYYCKKIIIEQD